VKAVSTAASTVRHTFGVALEAVLLLAIVAALIFGAALLAGVPPGGADSVFAAKGGSGNGHGGGAITVPDGVFAGTTTATVNPGGSGSWAFAQCYQGGTLVYAQYVEADSTNRATFTLGPTPLWTGGSANCTAEEGVWGSSGRWRTVAETTFDVSG
jgi:hypothetical protein